MITPVDEAVLRWCRGDHGIAQHSKENIMNTVMITGSSSGYGLETARFFLAQGWNVIATMPIACVTMA